MFRRMKRPSHSTADLAARTPGCLQGMMTAIQGFRKILGRDTACRPNATLHTGYVLRQEDPTQFGFQACQHAGCVNFTGNDVEP